MIRSTRALLIFAYFAASCSVAQPRLALPAVDAVEGTYEITICRDACQDEQVLVRGHLVLESRPYPLDSVPEPARSYFRRYEPYLLMPDLESDPNACFVLRRNAGARTYAGISRVGLTRWTLGESGKLMGMPVYNSPDAGYVTSFSIRAGELRGQGSSWGGDGEGETLPHDSIIGRRIGPADRALCLRAVEAELARRGLSRP